MHKKSVTLTEVLLATVVLAVGLCAVLLGLITSAVLTSSARNLTRATSHAQHIMEDIKNTNFTQVQTSIQSGHWDWNTADITSQGLTPLNNETIDTAVSGTTLLDITVTVNWQDRGARDRSTALKTLISQP